jgi:hypothetical protein
MTRISSAVGVFLEIGDIEAAEQYCEHLMLTVDSLPDIYSDSFKLLSLNVSSNVQKRF